MLYNIGLVLEGGGMRCEYTAGILDFLLENNIELKGCYGVSAGAVSGVNYIAKQKGRTLRITRDYIHDKRYCSLSNLLTTGNLFGVDMLYDKIPNELDPFDYESFLKSESSLTAVLTDTATGRPYYKTISDVRQHMLYLRASCTLPLVSRMVEIDGKSYLDGGITDSIPLAKSIEDGYTKNIVILTRHDKYQKKRELLSSLIGRFMYAKYPQLLKATLERHNLYNRQLELVREQEMTGNALVFRPKQPVTIKRAEKDKGKLTALYEQGYADANERLDEVKLFISSHQRK